ncbi:putative quinol monooxygenase [Cryptosporangium sp. NPDC048952]|uniref:putative quinol monooxygenase n=1 Tax=Cryptosporangium sp. NPDC048952 TaxID=3363961 RepID=UPI003716B4A8
MLESVLVAAERMSESSRTEPGCNEYRFSRDLTDPTVLVLAEEWATEDALQTHLASPDFTAFAEVFGRAIEGDPTFVRFDTAGPRPLFGATSDQ